MVYLLVARVFNGICALLLIPVALHFLGAASLAQIQFFNALIALIIIVDMGCSPIITRILARDTAQLQISTKLAIFKIILKLQLLLAFLAIIAIAYFLPEKFIQNQQNPELQWTLRLLAGGHIAIFLIINLLTAAISGLQNVHALTIFFALTGFIRLLAASFSLFIWDTVESFLMAQIIISLLCVLYMSRIVFSIKSSGHAQEAKSLLMREWQFGAAMFGIAILGAVMAQADKLLLSRSLSLFDFATYSSASTLASSLFLIIGAFFATCFAIFSSQYQKDVFSEGTQVQAVHAARALSFVLGLLASFLVCFSEDILRIWLRNAAVAQAAAPILVFLCLANLFNGMANIPYALQLASGRAKQALMMNLVAALVTIPILGYHSASGDGVAVAFSWMIVNACFAIVWPWIVVRDLIRLSIVEWLVKVVFFPLLAPFCASASLLFFSRSFFSTALNLYELGFVFFLHVAICVIAYPVARIEAKRRVIALFTR